MRRYVFIVVLLLGVILISGYPIVETGHHIDNNHKSAITSYSAPLGYKTKQIAKITRNNLHICVINDSDGDGLSDDEEAAWGTDPSDPRTLTLIMTGCQTDGKRSMD